MLSDKVLALAPRKWGGNTAPWAKSERRRGKKEKNRETSDKAYIIGGRAWHAKMGEAPTSSSSSFQPKMSPVCE